MQAFRYQAESWRLAAGERSFEGRGLVVAFVNGRQYGGGAMLVPGARLDDGLLDIVVIDDAPRFEIAWNATRMFVGGIEKFRRYHHIPAAGAVLTGTGPVLHHRDGEPEEGTERLEITLARQVLRVLVPRRTLANPDGPFGAGSAPSSPV
jgi:diacylglycerol kinase (ATP)